MFYLVRFVDDQIYYICSDSCLRKRKRVDGSVDVQWEDGFSYRAHIITSHESYPVLKHLLDDIRSKILYISVTASKPDSENICCNENFLIVNNAKGFDDTNINLIPPKDSISHELRPKCLSFASSAISTDFSSNLIEEIFEQSSNGHSNDLSESPVQNSLFNISEDFPNETACTSAVCASFNLNDDDDDCVSNPPSKNSISLELQPKCLSFASSSISTDFIDEHSIVEQSSNGNYNDLSGSPVLNSLFNISEDLPNCVAATSTVCASINLYEDDDDDSVADPDFNPADYESDHRPENTENIYYPVLSSARESPDINTANFNYHSNQANAENVSFLDISPIHQNPNLLTVDRNETDKIEENVPSVELPLRPPQSLRKKTTIIPKRPALATVDGSLPFSRSSVILPPQQPRMFNDIPPPVVDVGLAGRRASRKYFCIYCKTLSSNLPQHLKFRHSDQLAVKQFLNFPPCSKERKKIIETIRRNGDFEHNTYQEYNTGQVFIARRPATVQSPSTIITTCPECKGQFYKRSLRRHYKRCASQFELGDRSTLILSRAIHRQIHSKACSNLVTRIFPVLRDDDCVRVIQYDALVITIANHLCRLYPDPHFDDMIRAKLRLLGRLLIQARSLDSTVKDFASLITPIRYDLVISTINNVAGLNDAGTFYRAPTVATMSNTLLKVATDMWRIECIKTKDPARKTDAEDFMLLLKTDNATVINRIAIENRVQHQRQKKISLPDKSDVQQLVQYVRKVRRGAYSSLMNYKLEDNPFPYDKWHSLACATLISLLVFNRRRPGELERITLSDFHSRHKISNFESLDKEDCEAAESYSRFEIRGKLNRSVPVLVHWEVELCLNQILKHRASAGIPDDNPYVFGLPMVDHRQRYLRACVIMRAYSAECGAKEPHLLRATILRKQIATECAVLDLTENTIKDVAMFMGHAEDIHNKIYRLPVQTRDIVRMSRVLETIQGGKEVSDDEEDNEDCDDLENMYMNDFSSTAENQQGAGTSLNTARRSMSSIREFNDGQSVSAIASGVSYISPIITSNLSKKRKRSPEHVDDENVSPNSTESKKHSTGLRRCAGAKLPWTEEEKIFAEDLFGYYIAEERLPSFNNIMSTIQNSVLKSRSPQGVRLWIQNQIAKKRSLSICSDGAVGKKPRWSAEMKAILLKAFEEYIANNRLPSNAEIMIAMDNYPILKEKNVASIKTAVANERNRRRKSELAKRDLFLVQQLKRGR